MKISIVSKDPEICSILEELLYDFDIDIYNTKIEEYFFEHQKEMSIYICPGNSFGNMDGGYDQGIINVMGKQIERLVQKNINQNYGGVLSIGSAIYIEDENNHHIIYSPCMFFPETIRDYSIIFQCTYISLICARKHNFNNIILPVFGGETGEVPYNIIAKYMKLGVDSFINGINKEKIKHEIYEFL